MPSNLMLGDWLGPFLLGPAMREAWKFPPKLKHQSKYLLLLKS